MRVLLVNPPKNYRTKKNAWSYVGSNMPPLGLASIAAVLENNGHEVKILDACAEGMSVVDVVEWFARDSCWNFLGITATTPLINFALKIAEGVKQRNSEVKIVLGGVHPSVFPDHILQAPAVDFVVRGEGEFTMLELVSGNALESINGLSYLVSGKAVHTPDRELIENLDLLPMPAYHLLPMKLYRPALGAAKREPAISMLATRGCPGRCTFCFRQFGKKLRYRSGLLIAKEVKYLQDTYGIREICFYDDTFTALRKEVRDFCTELERLKVKISWSCFSRVDTFHEETFRLMRESGCHQVMFGVESASAEILKNINKRIDIDRAEHVIRSTMKMGILVRAAFMLGNMGETLETMEKTLEWALRVDPDLAVFNITTPYPGSELFDWAAENDFLTSYDWDKYDLATPILSLPTVDAETVARFYKYALRRFYLRPGKVMKIGLRMMNPRGFMQLYRGLRMMLGL